YAMGTRSPAFAGHGATRPAWFAEPQLPVHCLLAVILACVTPAVFLVVTLVLAMAFVLLVVALPLLVLAGVSLAPLAAASRRWRGWRRLWVFRLPSALWPWSWLIPVWLA